MTAGARNDVPAAVNRLEEAPPGPPVFHAEPGRLAPRVGPPRAGAGAEATGVARALTYNAPGHRQFTFSESTQLGDASQSGFRFVLGFPLPLIGAVNGTATGRGDMAVGSPWTRVGIGFAPGDPQGSTGVRLHVKEADPGPVGVLVESASPKDSDLQQWRANGQTVARVRAAGSIGLAALEDSATAPHSLSWSATTKRLASKDPAGTVHAVSPGQVESLERPAMGRRPNLPPLDPPQQELAARYLPFALARARRYSLDFAHLEMEFRSAAGLALVPAAQRWHPGIRGRFATYVRVRVLWAVQDVLKVEGGQPLTESSRMAQDALSRAVDRRPPHPPSLTDALAGLLGVLTVRSAAVVRMYHLDGYSPEPIGRRLGLSGRRVSEIARAAVAEMRRARETSV